MRTTRNEKRTVCEHDRLFLGRNELNALIGKAGTPLYLYDEKGLRIGAESLFATFKDLPGLRGYFPVHLCPCGEILQIISDMGLGAYCLTPEELRLVLQSGFGGEKILYVPMLLEEELALLLKELDVELMVVNPHLLDGVLPRRVTLACSPVRTVRNNFTPLGYHRAPLGLTRAEVLAAVPRLAQAGHDLGLAIIDGMNTTDDNHLAAKLKSLLKYEAEVHQTTGVHIRRLHPGEGPGIRYNRLLPPIDMKKTAANASLAVADTDAEISVNFGKCLLEPCGIFVTAVQSIITRERSALVVDAKTTQMLPSQMDRYRHVSIVGKDWVEGRKLFDIIGNRALSGDWFAERRILPEAEVGDLIVFHDAGCAPIAGQGAPCFLQREDGTVTCLQHGEE